MKQTVLITGFGRFLRRAVQSERSSRAVGKRQRPSFADVKRVVHIFETSYAAVDRDLPKLIAQHKPDIVLMFGLAARTPHVRIETRARNARSTLFPDVTGYRPDQREIVLGKPSSRGLSPFIRLLAASRNSRLRSKLSRDAGRYLCNTSTGARSRRRPDPARRWRSSSTFRGFRSCGGGPAAGSACPTPRSRAPERPFCWRFLPRSAVNPERLSQHDTACAARFLN